MSAMQEAQTPRRRRRRTDLARRDRLWNAPRHPPHSAAARRAIRPMTVAATSRTRAVAASAAHLCGSISTTMAQRAAQATVPVPLPIPSVGLGRVLFWIRRASISVRSAPVQQPLDAPFAQQPVAIRCISKGSCRRRAQARLPCQQWTCRRLHRLWLAGARA